MLGNVVPHVAFVCSGLKSPRLTVFTCGKKCYQFSSVNSFRITEKYKTENPKFYRMLLIWLLLIQSKPEAKLTCGTWNASCTVRQNTKLHLLMLCRIISIFWCSLFPILYIMHIDSWNDGHPSSFFTNCIQRISRTMFWFKKFQYLSLRRKTDWPQVELSKRTSQGKGLFHKWN